MHPNAQIKERTRAVIRLHCRLALDAKKRQKPEVRKAHIHDALRLRALLFMI